MSDLNDTRFNPAALRNQAAWRAAHRRTTKRIRTPTSSENQTMREILTPKSRRWKAFTEALERALQFNGCDGDRKNVHRHAKSILSLMEGVNVTETIEFFKANGGYCDCEILLKLDPWL